MKYQTVFACLLLFIGSVAQADVTRDGQGKTYLMHAIIKNEEQRAEIKAAKNSYISDMFFSGFSRIFSVKTRKNMQQARTFYNNNNQQQSAQLLGNVQGLVQLYTPHQLQLQATDHKGYSALNYCKTPEMYTLLRSHGAPFRCDAFLYIYGKKCILSTAAAGLFGCVAYQLYNK